ncbi:hypothetical protein [Thalassospira mesophila]|uniref:hypothetical protein n=1 Tax=Thalassospira mesophila TaxID=1293891 RepID=UPI00117D6889|nr:hypothetical protein [Thalassospira mesophila]
MSFNSVMTVVDAERLRAVRDRVWQHMAANRFAGADPFDGLHSKYTGSVILRHRISRLAWLQAMKHAPAKIRDCAAIPPMVNPKTLALLLGAGAGVPVSDWTVSPTSSAGTFNRAKIAMDLTRQLLALQNPDGGWGYPFAWQARAFFAQSGQSNAIVTCFVVDGLLNGGKMPPDHPALQAAAVFLQRDLWRKPPAAGADGGYFGYIAGADAEIYNVTLWAAWILWRLVPGNPCSQPAIDRVLGQQRADGAWVYGRRAHHGFVDGFHSGYILDLLHRLDHAGWPGLEKAMDRGWEFYQRACFDGQGLPRSFAGKNRYLDSHAVAQAMATLQRFGAFAQARNVALFAIDHLFDQNRGVFYAGIGRFGKDRRVFMRWTQAWMVWAVSIMLDKQTPGIGKQANREDDGTALF